LSVKEKKYMDALTEKYRLTIRVSLLKEKDFATVAEVENTTVANVFALNALQKALGKATSRLVVAATEGECQKLHEGDEGGEDAFKAMLLRAMAGAGRDFNDDDDDDDSED
jgi:hypothetical protein